MSAREPTCYLVPPFALLDSADIRPDVGERVLQRSRGTFFFPLSPHF